MTTRGGRSGALAPFTMGHQKLTELAQGARVKNPLQSHMTLQFDKPDMRPMSTPPSSHPAACRSIR